MSSSASLVVGQKVPVALVQTRADKSAYTPNQGDVTLSVQDPSIISLTDNGDGTGVITALAAGTSGVAGTDKVTGLQGTGSVSVTAPPPPDNPVTDAVIEFGTPA